MSKMLLNEKPLLVMPELARKIGLNEAIILQQIHYWNEINRNAKNNYRDGHYWTFNTYEGWSEQFPFWHKNTVSRIIKNLKHMRLIIIGRYNKLKIDRTQWYRIDYEALRILEESPLHHIGITNIQDWYQHLTNIVSPLPETNPENNSENNIYTVLTNDDVFMNIYNKRFKQKFGKAHMKVSEDQLRDIEQQIQEIQYCDIDTETWKEKVEEHFDNLPESNNGNIIAFLSASFRYFEVGQYS